MNGSHRCIGVRSRRVANASGGEAVETALKSVPPRKFEHALWNAFRIALVIVLFSFSLLVAGGFSSEAVRLQTCDSWQLAPSNYFSDASAAKGYGWRVYAVTVTPHEAGFQGVLNVGGSIEVLDGTRVALTSDWSTSERSCGLLGGCSQIGHYNATINPQPALVVPVNSPLLVIVTSGDYIEHLTITPPEPVPPVGASPSDRDLFTGSVIREASAAADGQHFSVALTLSGQPACTSAVTDQLISANPLDWLVSAVITGLVCAAFWYIYRKRR